MILNILLSKKGYPHKYQHLQALSFIKFILFRPLVWIACIILIVSFSCAPTKRVTEPTEAKLSYDSKIEIADKYMAEGVQYFQRGDFEQAISNFEEAERLYAKEKHSKKQFEVLVKLSQAYQSIGQIENALKSSNTAMEVAKGSGEQILVAEALSLSGSIYLGIGQTNEAYQYLDDGLRMARRLGNSKLTASILNNLGNLYTSTKEYDKAYAAYMECILISKDTGNRELVAIALTNAATATMRNRQYEKSKSLLYEALDQIRELEYSRNKAYSLINIGLVFRDLVPHFPEFKASLLQISSEIFNEAALVGEKIGDNHSISYACGYLGNLFEQEHRYEEALYVTRIAIFKAQEINAPEVLFRWQWQAGRVFMALNKRDEAMSLYRSSIQTLQSLRQEQSGCYGESHLTIHESVAQISFELVDLLLRQAASAGDPDQSITYLVEARELMELKKIYELRNYYRDDCVDAASAGVIQLDMVSKMAAIVYPIVLKDRIELLLTLSGDIKRFSVKVQEDTLTQEVRLFRRLLEKRTTREFLPHAQKLYDWIVRPLEADLKFVSADTLVFVPDGALRTIPMAALHNGERFLIEDYAIAVTPGLELTKPQPISEESPKVLAMALTEPAHGFPALPYVSSELQGIQAIYPSKLLINEDFLVSKMEEALRNQQYAILHVASHAQFGHNVENAFIVAYDGKLSINSLDQYIGLLQFRDYPLELLTLSACETAYGDDKAALGLAGIAIKAGARSALASLWHVNDLATSILVDEFYRELHKPSGSKAKALRSSQLKLLSDRRFQHPGYWSPFLIINNWL
jgi:CHAT domain-containing protein/Tfp pilus assembly protein PilF